MSLVAAIALVMDRMNDRLDDIVRWQEASSRRDSARDDVIASQQTTIHDLVIRAKIVTADHDGELKELNRRTTALERRSLNGHDAE